MALSIKNSEAEALVHRLAALTGESYTEAVKKAVEERLLGLTQKRDKVGLAERLLDMGRSYRDDCVARGIAPLKAEDHNELYDENGLPL